jgi:hypothetical protein
MPNTKIYSLMQCIGGPFVTGKAVNTDTQIFPSVGGVGKPLDTDVNTSDCPASKPLNRESNYRAPVAIAIGIDVEDERVGVWPIKIKLPWVRRSFTAAGLPTRAGED